MDYIECLGLSFPTVQAICTGDPTNYNDIQWVGGDPLPTQSALDSAIFSNTQKQVLAILSTACQNAIMAGFQSSALGQPYGYDSDALSQTNLLGAVAGTSPTPSDPNGTSQEYAVYPIVNGVNQLKVYISHTWLQLRQVLSDGAAFKTQQLLKYNAKREYIMTTATSVDQINAITWESTP